MSLTIYSASRKDGSWHTKISGDSSDGGHRPTPEPRTGDSFLIQHLREVAIDHQNGLFAGTNDVVDKIGGRPPLTLEDFIEKHRESFA
jgi:hypothetical protein